MPAHRVLPRKVRRVAAGAQRAVDVHLSSEWGRVWSVITVPCCVTVLHLPAEAARLHRDLHGACLVRCVWCALLPAAASRVLSLLCSAAERAAPHLGGAVGKVLQHLLQQH